MSRKRIKSGIVVSVSGTIIKGKHTRAALEFNHIVHAAILKAYLESAPKTPYTMVFGTKMKLVGKELIKAQASGMLIIWE